MSKCLSRSRNGKNLSHLFTSIWTCKEGTFYVCSWCGKKKV